LRLGRASKPGWGVPWTGPVVAVWIWRAGGTSSPAGVARALTGEAVADVAAVEGQVVAERYRLVRPIGHSPSGVVWRATDLRLDRVVAVKQLRLTLGLTRAEADQARQRVVREARIVARLEHPYAVTVLDVVVDGEGQPALIMEYVPSRNLATVLAERATLPVAQVAQVGAQVAAALAAAHATGIVHRDVRPSNILLTEDGAARITDFGISRASDDVMVTRLDGVAGTPAYLAPETARGEPARPAADVFSLGATLYAAVEGHPPFGEVDDPVAQLHRVTAGRPARPRRAGPLTAVVSAALDDDRRRRPTMAQLAGTLAAIAAQPAAGLADAATVDAATVVVTKVAVPALTRVDLHPADVPEEVEVPVPGPHFSRRATWVVAGVVVAVLVALLVAGLLVTSDDSGTGDSLTPSGAVDVGRFARVESFDGPALPRTDRSTTNPACSTSGSDRRVW
jgi:hypothetical protein